MNPRQIIVVLLVYAAVVSGLLTYLDLNDIAEPEWLAVVTTVLSTLLIFWWYWSDSTGRAYRRSLLLNVAVVALTFVAIPYYLARSRVTGERFPAFARLLGFVALTLLALFAGGLSGALLS